MEMAAFTLRRMASTSGRSRRSPEPPLDLTTLLTGQPKLMSTTSKPRSWQTRAGEFSHQQAASALIANEPAKHGVRDPSHGGKNRSRLNAHRPDGIGQRE